MNGAIYFIIAGTVIGILTLIKPNFFWNHPKAAFVRRFLGDRGTTIFYLLASVAMLSFGIYSMTKINAAKELEEISTLYQNGKVDDAQKRLLSYTSDHYNEYLAWTILGHTYLDQENFEKAIESYNNGIQADTTAFEPHSGLGLVYAKMGEYEKAKNAYEKANAISPNKGSVIGNLAGLYDDLGDIKKSIEYGEKSIQLDPTDVTLVVNLSVYYNKAGQIDKRDQMFNKAKELGYTDLQALTDTYSINNDTTSTKE